MTIAPPERTARPASRRKRPHVREVVEDVGHHDRAQAAGPEGQGAGVGDERDALPGRDLRGDQRRQELPQESAAGSELQHPSVSARQCRQDASVPLAVDLPEERLRAEDRRGATSVVCGWSTSRPRVAGVSSQRAQRPSHELEAARGDPDHAQQQPAVAPALDVRLAVRALAVADRHVHDAQVQLRRAEEQVEVAERIEVAEVRAVGGDPLVVSSSRGPWSRRACP